MSLRFFVYVWLCMPFLTFGQGLGGGCCTKFSALASLSGFKEVHLMPNYAGADSLDLSGRMVGFATPDGLRGGAYLIGPKNKKPSKNWLFIFHEWWGLTPMVKAEADYWANKLDINVLAIDLYDGKIAQTKDQAAVLMQALKHERAKSIIMGAAGLAGDKANIATLGWCLGGSWSMQTALLLGRKVKACIIYYGMPETNPKLLKTLYAPVLGIFAQKDAWISPQIVAEADKIFTKKNKKHTFISYPAAHAFANPSNPDFQAEYTNQAKKQSEEFLKLNLPTPIIIPLLKKIINKK